jgi:class 3 adenylate cyclase
MLDVARWLAEKGLGHHAEAFAENGIAGDVLCDLNDADLRELGLNLGDRKRLVKAIAALSAGSANARTETAEPTGSLAVAHEAERRQLTVLFVDLVGSTELAGRLDPEDVAEMIRAYQRCCTAEVERWDGHVAKYMGDGVLAYFGWPQAHEDEAERAVRAGLAIIEALARLETRSSAPLAARIGIATGLVMVGELIGEGAAQERTVVGETPNLAARLQVLAGPGSVLISQRPDGWLAGCSRYPTSVRSGSKAPPSRWPPGGSTGTVIWSAAGKQRKATVSPNGPGVTKACEGCFSPRRQVSSLMAEIDR